MASFQTPTLTILHLLSQQEVTGAEVYAATLATAQVQSGHTVIIVSDTWHTPTEAEYISLPLGKKGFWLRRSNASAVRKLIQDRKVDVVHAHSRASSWVGTKAVAGTKVPLVSTVHGRQHIHWRSKSTDPYGDKVLPVCEAIGQHLVHELNIKPHKVQVVPNAFKWQALAHLRGHKPNGWQEYQGATIVMAGRTSGPKGVITGQVLAQIMPSLLAQYPDFRFLIFGGKLEEFSQEVQVAYHQLQGQYGTERIAFMGFTQELERWLATSDLVIGSGRVAIEALRLGVPTLAVGEWEAIGFINSDTLQHGIASNFGDTGPSAPSPGIDYAKIESGLHHWLKSYKIEAAGLEPWIPQYIEQHYSLHSGYAAVLDQYLSARAKKLYGRHIPVLMYHKVLPLPSNSKHRIFVTVDTLRQHFQYLKNKGYTTITFQDYHRWKLAPSQGTLPKKPIILTFDDGYVNNHTYLLPMLQEFGFKAVIYPIPAANNFWDAGEGEPLEPLMNAQQLRDFVQAGHELGSHTMTHIDLSQEHDAALVEQEFEQSVQFIKSITGTEVLSLAYPYGRVKPEFVALANKYFKYAVLINEGTAMHIEDDPHRMFRAYIFPEDLASRYAKKTAWWYRAYFKWKRKR